MGRPVPQVGHFLAEMFFFCFRPPVCWRNSLHGRHVPLAQDRAQAPGTDSGHVGQPHGASFFLLGLKRPEPAQSLPWF